MGKRLRIIAYDVACDRRRRRLEKLACRYAVRVQDSVFEGWMTDDQVAELLRRAAPFIKPPADSLRVYGLCAQCSRAACAVGGKPSPAPPPDDVFA
jgi:CRISPR-associated protein Cas2